MIDHYTDLSDVGQAFIDAIARNNGQVPELKPQKVRKPLKPAALPSSTSTTRDLPSLIKALDPDMGYDDWLKVGMAIYYTTGGCDEGLALFDEWSAQGSKYQGLPEIEKKWCSFDPHHPRPVTIGTLIWMLENGVGVRDD